LSQKASKAFSNDASNMGISDLRLVEMDRFEAGIEEGNSEPEDDGSEVIADLETEVDEDSFFLEEGLCNIGILNEEKQVKLKILT
jgi:hypothetical protein